MSILQFQNNFNGFYLYTMQVSQFNPNLNAYQLNSTFLFICLLFFLTSLLVVLVFNSYFVRNLTNLSTSTYPPQRLALINLSIPLIFERFDVYPNFLTMYFKFFTNVILFLVPNFSFLSTDGQLSPTSPKLIHTVFHGSENTPLISLNDLNFSHLKYLKMLLIFH